MFRDRNEYQKIDYTIESFSSYASNYKPENIIVENNTDPSSRWSTSAASLDQYVLLKLKCPALVMTISFGKYCKVHVCNVKELKVYSDDFEVLKCTLKNDTEKETYNLKYTTGNTFLVSDRIKICPLSSWGMNFNYSIWYVELRGYTEVSRFIDFNSKYADFSASKLALKFINKKMRDNLDIKKCFSKFLDMEVDHESISQTKSLIAKKRYGELENYIEALGDKGIFNDFIESMPYFAEWEQIEKKDSWPQERGGHQIAPKGKKLLLYGGWDGEKELGDMWEFDTEKQKWAEVPQEGNTPGRRSCHKIVIVDDVLYVFGRYVPIEYQRQSNWFEREVFYFKDGKWNLKKYLNGPSNLFDHQVVATKRKPKLKKDAITDYLVVQKPILNHDSRKKEENLQTKQEVDTDRNNCISLVRLKPETCQNYCLLNDSKENPLLSDVVFFLFGGRSQNDQYYAGLYELENFRMKVLRSNSLQPENSPELKGRVGHTMLYIPPGFFEEDSDHESILQIFPLSNYNNSLLIIGGQRMKDNYKEITFYSVETDTVYKNVEFPISSEGKVIQRALLRKHEILVHFSYSKERDKLNETGLWIYNLKLNKWIECKSQNSPCARSAHQFVECNGFYYMHGGNLGYGNKRAGDMWKLNLKKKNTKEIVKDIKFLVRKHIFLSIESKIEALKYLQSHIYGIVDHKLESLKYAELCCMKLKNVSSTDESLLESILAYFPQFMKTPENSLEDLCK